MKQVTLISLYGEKNSDLAALIAECQQLVAETVKEGTFESYDSRQIHATIIGLERRIGSPTYNTNFKKYRGRDVKMNFDGFLSYLRGCGHFPLEVQISGFGAKRNYPFTSRNTIPYERSFSIQEDKEKGVGMVVMMGWPVRGEPFSVPPATPQTWVQEARIYQPTLDIVRHAAQGFGILHAYHRALTDVDNDLFFRIGLINDPSFLKSDEKKKLEKQVREVLSNKKPFVVEIRLDDIYIAAYEDERLPLFSTQSWSLADSKVTGTFVSELFT